MAHLCTAVDPTNTQMRILTVTAITPDIATLLFELVTLPTLQHIVLRFEDSAHPYPPLEDHSPGVLFEAIFTLVRRLAQAYPETSIRAQGLSLYFPTADVGTYGVPGGLGATFFDSILEYAPNVREVEWYNQPIADDSVGRLTDRVVGAPSIHSLRTGVTPNFESRYVWRVSITPPTALVRHLRDLELYIDMMSVEDFASFDMSALFRLSVKWHCGRYGPPDQEDLTLIFHAIGTQAVRVRTLEICLFEGHPRSNAEWHIDHPALANHTWTHVAEYIRPLKGLRLEDFSLTALADVNPASFKEVALAWPTLHTLQLFTRGFLDSWTEPNRLSTRDLFNIIPCFPALLHLTADVSIEPEASPDSPLRIQAPDFYPCDLVSLYVATMTSCDRAFWAAACPQMQGGVPRKVTAETVYPWQPVPALGRVPRSRTSEGA